MNLDINLSNKQLIVRKKVVSFIKNYAKFNNTAFEYEHLKAVLYNEKKFINEEELKKIYEFGFSGNRSLGWYRGGLDIGTDLENLCLHICNNVI